MLQLQKDLDEVRAEFRYCNAGRPTTPAQTSTRSCSNGCDEVTAALQLVAHLEGDALNVALPGVAWSFAGALSEHHSSPGRLAEYRRQFERASPSPGDDPSVSAIELETLARRAFVDVDASVRLQLVRDSFIAGQAGCSLRRHLDSVGPDTPMVEIVDRCRVWESHAEDVRPQIGPSSGGLPGG